MFNIRLKISKYIQFISGYPWWWIVAWIDLYLTAKTSTNKVNHLTRTASSLWFGYKREPNLQNLTDRKFHTFPFKNWCWGKAKIQKKEPLKECTKPKCLVMVRLISQKKKVTQKTLPHFSQPEFLFSTSNRSPERPPTKTRCPWKAPANDKGKWRITLPKV